MKSHVRRGFLLLLLSAGMAAAQPTNKSPSEASRVRTDLVVSTRWLTEHAKDANLVLIHVGGSLSDYHAAHIPGARYLANDKLVDTHSQPPVELLPPDQIKANLEAVGISDKSRVVFYSPDWDPIATRLFFTLDYIGHGDHAALLDGGNGPMAHRKTAHIKGRSDF